MSNNRVCVGIIGGMGPAAGVDLSKKVYQIDEVSTDQEHCNLVLISFPQIIPDRTQYILCSDSPSPLPGIKMSIDAAINAGANLLAIACNSSHSSEIFNNIKDYVERKYYEALLLNMPDQVSLYIKKELPSVRRIGILSTIGTAKAHIYDPYLKNNNIVPMYPNEEELMIVHDCIYNPKNGIKKIGFTRSALLKDRLFEVIESLVNKGAQAILLACTELPLVIKDSLFEGNIIILDANYVFAAQIVNKMKSY